MAKGDEDSGAQVVLEEEDSSEAGADEHSPSLLQKQVEDKVDGLNLDASSLGSYPHLGCLSPLH